MLLSLSSYSPETHREGGLLQMLTAEEYKDLIDDLLEDLEDFCELSLAGNTQAKEENQLEEAQEWEYYYKASNGIKEWIQIKLYDKTHTEPAVQA